MTWRQGDPRDGIEGWLAFTGFPTLLSGGFRTFDADEPTFVDLGRPLADDPFLFRFRHCRFLRLWARTSDLALAMVDHWA